MRVNEIYEQLKQRFTEEQLLLNEPMSKHTSFKTGGNADIFIYLKTIEDVQFLKKYIKNKEIQLYIIGNGTNILVRDEGIRGIVGKLEFNHYKITAGDNYTDIEVQAGFSLSKLSMIAMEKGLEGLEFTYGIPGTVGGAIKMNAGAYGGEMKDVVLKTKYMDEDGKIHQIEIEEHKFGYRKSFFTNEKHTILSTIIRLKKGCKDGIKRKMQEYLTSRKTNQPLEFWNAGSTFKRGEGFITSKLIDECGLKGFTIGGASVSEKHAGFIVNKGTATSQDILNLIAYIKKEVYKKFGKEIELEIIVI